MPSLVDDGPGRIVAAFVVAEEDGQQWHTRQEAAAPEVQHTAAVTAGALWGRHQHGEPPVACSAHATSFHRLCRLHPSSTLLSRLESTAVPLISKALHTKAPFPELAKRAAYLQS